MEVHKWIRFAWKHRDILMDIPKYIHYTRIAYVVVTSDAVTDAVKSVYARLPSISNSTQSKPLELTDFEKKRIIDWRKLED